MSDQPPPPSEIVLYQVNGVSVEYARPDGTIAYDSVLVLDFEAPDANDWLTVNQLTVTEAGHTRRPDVVVFVNGLPIAVIELKNAASENASVWVAFQQLQTYKRELPSLFVFNELLVASDGINARVGTLSSNRERFLPWRTVELLRKLLDDEVKVRSRRNVTIDWAVKESVRAKLRVLVKRILKKYGYPPDKQELATSTVLQQAELLSAAWAAPAA